jgi:hypothetical protein
MYVRMHSAQSAMALYNRVAHDGHIAMKSGYPTEMSGVTLKPGMLFSDIGVDSSDEDDCAHFLSCCLGRTHFKWDEFGGVIMRGGGLDIPSPFKNRGVYGQTYVAQLAQSLLRLGGKIIPPQFRPTQYDSTRDAIRHHLKLGDVLFYLSKDNPNSYQHSAILVGPTNIACHTKARQGLDYTDVHFPWVMLVKLPG